MECVKRKKFIVKLTRVGHKLCCSLNRIAMPFCNRRRLFDNLPAGCMRQHDYNRIRDWLRLCWSLCCMQPELHCIFPLSSVGYLHFWWFPPLVFDPDWWYSRCCGKFHTNLCELMDCHQRPMHRHSHFHRLAMANHMPFPGTVQLLQVTPQYRAKNWICLFDFVENVKMLAQNTLFPLVRWSLCVFHFDLFSVLLQWKIRPFFCYLSRFFFCCYNLRVLNDKRSWNLESHSIVKIHCIEHIDNAHQKNMLSSVVNIQSHFKRIVYSTGFGDGVFNRFEIVFCRQNYTQTHLLYWIGWFTSSQNFFKLVI